jgi:hypothetical protein
MRDRVNLTLIVLVSRASQSPCLPCVTFIPNPALAKDHPTHMGLPRMPRHAYAHG